MSTGRTVSKYFKFQIGDTSNVLRDIPVETIPEIGLNYDEVDVSAVQDLIKKQMAGQGAFSVTITGPLDTTTPVTASASTEAASAHMSGSYNVLQPLNGGQTPRSVGFYFGIQGPWTATTDPVFGGIATCIVTGFTVSGEKYSAKISYSGAATNALAWGTAVIAGS
jgi:hypothetical protein